MHGIDEETWLAFLDGEAAPGVEGHLRWCVECAETLEQLRALRGTLLAEARRLRDAAGISEARMEQMLDACLEQLACDREWTPQQATYLLRSLLEPFCGAGAAKTITELTIRKSASQGFDPAGWRLFVGNLSRNVESICGIATGRLIARAGFSLSVGSA